MTYAAALSPFGVLTEEEYWSLWQKQSPVLMLEEAEQTDGRYVYPPDASISRLMQADAEPSYITPAAVQRHQYNSVLSRFAQASKRAGTFSSWDA